MCLVLMNERFECVYARAMHDKINYFVIVIIITEIGIVTNNSTFIKLCMCICALHRSSCDEIFIVSVVFDNNCWTAP